MQQSFKQQFSNRNAKLIRSLQAQARLSLGLLHGRQQFLNTLLLLLAVKSCYRCLLRQNTFHANVLRAHGSFFTYLNLLFADSGATLEQALIE